MPIKGQILRNPKFGDTYEFLETAQDTHGERVTIKSTVISRGKLLPNHFHVLQDETFEVLSGTMTFWVDGKTFTLNAGEKIIIPKNTPHNHYHVDDFAITYIYTVTPAFDFDYFLENSVGLAVDGKLTKGHYGFIQQLVTLKYLEGKSYLADVPVWLQKLLMNTIAPIARYFGYRAIYKKYSGIEK
jgi:quercetin dioxygenase-like cupin family protein